MKTTARLALASIAIFLPVVARAQSPTDVINAAKPTSDLGALGRRAALSGGTVTNTGAFTTTIGLGLPPARAGLVPHLELNYSSQAGVSRIGYNGWSLSAGYIRRSQRVKMPETNQLIYEYSFNGQSGELISQGPDTTGYELWVDRLGWVRYRFLLDTVRKRWIVLLPDGRRLTFGDSTLAPNECVEEDAGLPIRWNLCEEEDREHNKIKYDWSKTNCYMPVLDVLRTVSTPRLVRATYNLRADGLDTAQRYVDFRYECVVDPDRSTVRVEGSRALFVDEAYLSKVTVKAQGTDGVHGEPGQGAVSPTTTERTLTLERGPESAGSSFYNLVGVTPAGRPQTRFDYTAGPSGFQQSTTLTGPSGAPQSLSYSQVVS